MRCTVGQGLLLVLAAYSHAADGPELGLVLNFDSAPSPVFLQTMKAELGSILAPAHLKLNWVTLDKTRGLEGQPRVMILRFHGNCAAAKSNVQTQVDEPQNITLASTAFSGDLILPDSESNCDKVRNFVESKPAGQPGSETRLGLAMARVMAHEVYHFLLQTRHHGKKGISRARMTPSALVGPVISFDRVELEKISGQNRNAPEAIAPAHSFLP